MAQEQHPADFKPYVPDSAEVVEFTPRAVMLGMLFGIIFGAVTVYVGLRAGLTVAASIPIAVLSISLLRALGRATILENNIVQTTGSAGESVAGGVIFTLPALIFLGFSLEYSRILLLATIGGLLGVLFMVPLRRQLIVKEHGNLLYPEGTACADVLIAGEKGGSFAGRVFYGLGLGGVYTLLQNSNAFAVLRETPTYDPRWLPGASLRATITSEYLGVGYIIGPRIAGVIFAGGVFSWLVMMPAIKFFGSQVPTPIYPSPIPIAQMSSDELWRFYIRYIGAGAVAASGLITLIKTLPTIVAALTAGAADLRRARAGAPVTGGRTTRDLSMKVVLAGSAGIVAAMWAFLTLKPVPGAPTGPVANLIAALLVVVFGFLFVTVSSRIAGLIGTSSNPISGMAIATLMATCALFLLAGWTAAAYGALALSIGGTVCIAAANAGNTSQDLKTGFLVGATPNRQQWAILIGAVTSALVIGITMLLLNKAAVHYTKKDLPDRALEVPADAPREQPGRPYDTGWEGQEPDTKEYRVVHVRRDEMPGVKAGRYLVDDAGRPVYRTDEPIAREEAKMDNGKDAPKEFTAPQPRLFANIIEGILGGTLEWSLIIIGVLIAVTLELCGVSALPVAVGMYLSLGSTTPIFIGGMVRLAADRVRGKPKTEAESETSPGVLLASGYIAGGTLCGLIIAFFAFLPDWFNEALNLGFKLFQYPDPETGKAEWDPDVAPGAQIASVIMFGLLGAFLFWIGSRKRTAGANGPL